jgi:hypothetical protein
MYVILMIKTNKYDTIISLARKMPDTPVEQIIAQVLAVRNGSFAERALSGLIPENAPVSAVSVVSL